TLAHDRTHRAAHEFEFKRCNHSGNCFDATLHHNERVSLTQLRLGGFKPIGVTFSIFEFQRVYRLDFCADFKTSFSIKNKIQSSSSRDSVMMSTLMTDFCIALRVTTI